MRSTCSTTVTSRAGWRFAEPERAVNELLTNGAGVDGCSPFLPRRLLPVPGDLSCVPGELIWVPGDLGWVPGELFWVPGDLDS